MNIGKNKRKIYLSLLLFELTMLILFLQNHHRVKVVLFKVVETSDRGYFEWAPAKIPSWYRLDSPISYKDFATNAQRAIFNLSSELEQCAALMNHIRGLGNGMTTGILMVTDSVYRVRELLKNGYEGNCAHYSWLFMAYLRSLNRDARVIYLDQNDGLGGNGHAVNEVWVKGLQKWVLFDTHNNAFFMFEDMPLSTLEIRDKIYEGKSYLISVKQGDVFDVSKNEIISYYTSLISNITLDGRSDLIYRYEHRYGLFQAFAPIFGKLPRYLRRALANVGGNRDLRIHFVDAKAMRYHPVLYKTIFMLLIFGILVTLNAIIWQFYQRPRRGR